jgi:hypothetical protein
MLQNRIIADLVDFPRIWTANLFLQTLWSNAYWHACMVRVYSLSLFLLKKKNPSFLIKTLILVLEYLWDAMGISTSAVVRKKKINRFGEYDPKIRLSYINGWFLLHW